MYTDPMSARHTIAQAVSRKELIAVKDTYRSAKLYASESDIPVAPQLGN
jgi:hypothetical protein